MTASRAPRLAPRVITAMLLMAGFRRWPGSSRGAGASVTRDSSHTRIASSLLLAAAGPAVAVARIRGAASWRWPKSGLGTLWLAGWVVANVVVEEVLWRGPVAVLAGRRAAAPAALLSAGASVAIHVRRDGLESARVHVPNTLAWTTAALLSGRLAPAAVAHLGYNLAAHGLRARPETDPATAAATTTTTTTTTATSRAGET